MNEWRQIKGETVRVYVTNKSAQTETFHSAGIAPGFRDKQVRPGEKKLMYEGLAEHSIWSRGAAGGHGVLTLMLTDNLYEKHGKPNIFDYEIVWDAEHKHLRHVALLAETYESL